MTFTKRNALVTGAGALGGLGHAVARILASGGAYVTVTGRDPQHGAQVVEDLGAKARFLPADLSDSEDVRSVHGARSIRAEESSDVTHSGAMLRSRALAERRRTVFAVMGEYWASHPTRAPAPVTSTSVTTRPSGDRASVSTSSPCRAGVRAIRSFIALCLSLSCGVAAWVRGRCAATHVTCPWLRRRRTNIHGDLPARAHWHSSPR
ncbi:hypothetical protein SUDANB43_00017 [Streptomyces sp. enrichment culture]